MPYHAALDALANGARRVAAVLACLVAVSTAVRAAPCDVREGESGTDLAACLTEAPSTGHVRHMAIDLAWAGPGTAHRVLDLRLPDNVQLEARQRELDAAGQPTAAPVRVLQVLGLDSLYEERKLSSPRVALALDLTPGRMFSWSSTDDASVPAAKLVLG